MEKQKKYLQIVLNVPLDYAFTYLDLDDCEKSKFAFRVEINFGNRKTIGCVIDESYEFPKNCPVPKEEIRSILRVLDSEPLFTKETLLLAKWISHYYVCSLGEALFTIIPSGRRENSQFSDFFSFSEDPFSNPKKLSSEQQNAVNEILKNESQTNFHYLYGPTGSGKTEVFLQTAQKILNENKGVIYLVPEISLTTQVAKSVFERFGEATAILHSNLTANKKLYEWKKILSGKAKIVVGARSAVFAPVQNLGLIIVDEEHDSSYKSSSSPRYHARQVAMHRCSALKIPLLMGSATASVEAFYLMKIGAIKKHILSKRLAGGAMPKIEVVNLSNEKMEGCLSKKLENEIKLTLNEGRQTVLFLNRRGFTHFFRCNSCGFELKCKNCSVSMTFHRAEKRLRCHYCGWSCDSPSQCPECGSFDVGYFGFGTEFIENEVAQKFPSAKIVRVDADSVKRKGELQEKIDSFKNGKFDIMLGTQMVAKGLNFPNLKLVGVISADTGLHLPDFRSSERVFSLITQVSGRAGRFFPDGKVLIQSYCPDRSPIYAATLANQKASEEFYEKELFERQQTGFPPFSRLARIVFRSPSLPRSENAAQNAKEILEEFAKKINEKIEILGPAECPISKIATNFRFQILLRSKKISLLQNLCRHLLYDFKAPSSLYIEIDIDPVNLL